MSSEGSDFVSCLHPDMGSGPAPQQALYSDVSETGREPGSVGKEGGGEGTRQGRERERKGRGAGTRGKKGVGVEEGEGERM